MKIAYVTAYDARDVSNWSGLAYYIAQALSNQSLSVEHVGPLGERFSSVFAMKQCIYNRLLHKRYHRDREPLLLKYYALQVSRQLPPLGADVVFSPGTIPISYLECEKPIVFWTGSTFAGMTGFYPSFSNLCEETIRNGHAMESSALKRAKIAIYASEWAAESAVKYYNADASKVKIVPFGANIECDRNLNDSWKIVDSRPSNTCRLLFLGVEWQRKGGDIAVEIAKELHRSGLKVELRVAGCKPRYYEPLPRFVRSLGFISKTTIAGQNLINELFADSHFLLMPSRAECFGVVFCEANSFGVPCLSTNVGGIPTVVRDNVNGKTFSKDAHIMEYCTYITDLFTNYARYKELALSSFNEYQCRLNWSVAGETVKKLLEEVPS